MDNKPKKNVKKPKKRAPRRRQIKKDKSVKQNVNVTVSSGGGSGGSGGAAIPSQPQPQFAPLMQSSREDNFNIIKKLEELKNKQEELKNKQEKANQAAIRGNPFLEASMRANREDSTNLLNQLSDLQKKQDQQSQLLLDLRQKPEDIKKVFITDQGMQTDFPDVLQTDQGMQTDFPDNVMTSSQFETPLKASSSSSMETPNKDLTPFEEDEDERALKKSLRKEIKKLGGEAKRYNSATLQTLERAVEFLRIQKGINEK